MDRTHRIAIALAAGLLFLFPGSAWVHAGEVHRDFFDQLSRTPAHESLSGLVMLAEQPDPAAAQRHLAARGIRSRWRRHQVVVQNAQEVAARTQRDLLQTLEGLRRAGRVQSYQSFWVTNMIAVEARPEVFSLLARRPDVGTIYENAQIQLRTGWEDREADQGGPRTLPNNLVCVNVAPAWEQGYRGQGSLVACFDTGADGNHPAYADLWRGRQEGVHWSAAWKDPYNNTTFPYDAGTHGTHVLGIMVATRPDGTAIGVAPQAQWIAAGILINYNVQKIIECYQWAVDPDGNPGTIADVPDVINNSWGTSGDCDMTYWNAIELVEAAGIVNTIAIDNTGPGYASVNSPESRAASPTVNWGVGNVNPHVAGYPIASNSGRGPSPCDYTSIKPEVTAPGTQIVSTLPGGGYGSRSGTSMACPHTSGAVAILRQINPDLTVDEVKTALMVTAFDRGAVGEDNDYGWGIIDIGAAVEYVLQTLPLYPPRDLTAEVEEQDVRLRWREPELIRPNNPLIRYRIFRAPIEEPFPLEPIAEVGAIMTNPQYVDRGVPVGQYHYVITALYLQGESGPSNEAEAYVNAPAAAEREETFLRARLSVAPNPFNPVTVVRYESASTEPLSIRVYDAAGTLVRTLAQFAPVRPGAQSILWDGLDDDGHALPSGSYYVRVKQDGGETSRRVTLLK